MHRFLRLVPLQTAGDASDLFACQRFHDFANLLLREPLLSVGYVSLRLVHHQFGFLLPLANLLLHCLLEVRLLHVRLQLVGRHLRELVHINVHAFKNFKQLLVLLAVGRDRLVRYDLVSVKRLLAVIDHLFAYRHLHLTLHVSLHGRALL